MEIGRWQMGNRLPDGWMYLLKCVESWEFLGSVAIPSCCVCIGCWEMILYGYDTSRGVLLVVSIVRFYAYLYTFCNPLLIVLYTIWLLGVHDVCFRI